MLFCSSQAVVKLKTVIYLYYSEMALCTQLKWFGSYHLSIWNWIQN